MTAPRAVVLRIRVLTCNLTSVRPGRAEVLPFLDLTLCMVSQEAHSGIQWPASVHESAAGLSPVTIS